MNSKSIRFFFPKLGFQFFTNANLIGTNRTKLFGIYLFETMMCNELYDKNVPILQSFLSMCLGNGIIVIAMHRDVIKPNRFCHCSC